MFCRSVLKRVDALIIRGLRLAFWMSDALWVRPISKIEGECEIGCPERMFCIKVWI